MMSKILSLALFICGLSIMLFSGCTTSQLTVEWQSETTLCKPECVVYSPGEHVLFISNVNGSPAKSDGNGFISKIEMNGRIAELKWVDGLNAPKGMGILDGLLYVTDISRIVIIDIDSRAIVKTIDVDDADFLNDIVVITNDRFIVSDTKTDSLFIIEEGRTSKIEHRLKNANGLYYDKPYVYIGADKKVYKYDLEKDTIECELENTGNVDGLVKKGPDVFYYSNYFNKLVKYDNGKTTVLLKGLPFMDCVADFCMIGDKIVVPDLDNAVTMFSEL